MRAALAGLLLLAAPLGAQAAFPWTPGSRIHVAQVVYARTDTLGVGTKVLRTVGDKGTITGGPAGSTTAYGTSWLIHYDTPPDGWSTQQYLALDALAEVTRTDTINRTWTLRSRVHTTGAAVYVRADSTCCSVIAETLKVGIKGTLVGGPWLASDNGVRWRVAYDGHTTGWSRQELLAMDSLAGTTPPPPPPPTVAVVRIDGFLTGALTLALGATHQFQAIAVDASGAVVPTVFTWRAAAPAIAPVDAAGLVTARSAGIGLDTVSATAPNGVRAWFLINVSAAPPPPSPLAWGGRALSLDALKFARPPCIVNWTAGVTTVCGPYARLDDSTGVVLQHFTVTFTVSP